MFLPFFTHDFPSFYCIAQVRNPTDHCTDGWYQRERYKVRCRQGGAEYPSLCRSLRSVSCSGLVLHCWCWWRWFHCDSRWSIRPMAMTTHQGGMNYSGAGADDYSFQATRSIPFPLYPQQWLTMASIHDTWVYHIRASGKDITMGWVYPRNSIDLGSPIAGLEAFSTKNHRNHNFGSFWLVMPCYSPIICDNWGHHDRKVSTWVAVAQTWMCRARVPGISHDGQYSLIRSVLSAVAMASDIN